MAAKEYGERVDRMCWELEVIGLPDPRFNNDTFILKATVKSASIGRESTQNASIQQNDASIHEKDGLMTKLQELELIKAITKKDASDAEKIIENVDVLQVITAKEVMMILSCKTTKARLILKVMESNGLIRTIQGRGKGKYILNVTE